MFRALRRHFETQKTVRELSALSRRELADIGITREDIPRVARGASL